MTVHCTLYKVLVEVLPCSFVRVTCKDKERKNGRKKERKNQTYTHTHIEREKERERGGESERNKATGGGGWFPPRAKLLVRASLLLSSYLSFVDCLHSSSSREFD